ncbi:MAG TPA: ferrous iron transport protein A [Methylophaga sp.]|jgi:ferrous iron transport protein A|nr:ferrous iron transport protein A [Methylophaga sp.]
MRMTDSSLACTLWQLQEGKSAFILATNKDINPILDARIQDLGLGIGEQIRCLCKGPFNGTIVIQVGDCIYSLDPSLAKQIQVIALG